MQSSPERLYQEMGMGFDPGDSAAELGRFGPAADLMKPETRERGEEYDKVLLISIYLNELWHKLPRPLSAVKIKWDLQSLRLIQLMCPNYWQGPVRYH